MTDTASTVTSTGTLSSQTMVMVVEGQSTTATSAAIGDHVMIVVNNANLASVFKLTFNTCDFSDHTIILNGVTDDTDVVMSLPARNRLLKIFSAFFVIRKNFSRVCRQQS